MANQELVSMLHRKNGVEEFNDYRLVHPGEMIDLYGADFHEADLRGVNFSEMNLHETNFSRADLQGASFGKASLCKANFSGASLCGTNFYGADLRAANFSGAYLFSETHLVGANLTMVSGLKRADWKRICRETAYTIRFAD